MPRHKYTRRPFYDLPTTPFDNSEDAWFWYIRCQQIRRDGAKFPHSPGSSSRPCDPDDLYRSVKKLLKLRRIGKEHVIVLNTFGVKERSPDPRCREEERAARLWDEALDRLTTILREKGIIE